MTFNTATCSDPDYSCDKRHKLWSGLKADLPVFTVVNNTIKLADLTAIRHVVSNTNSI